MAKFNADEAVFEPIEVTLGGTTYRVDTLCQSSFEKVVEISKEETGTQAVFEQLAVLFGVDSSVFIGTDVRRASAALKFVIDTITSQMESVKGNG